MSSSGANLCVSSTNAGACATALTDSGGCGGVTSFWFDPCNNTIPATGPPAPFPSPACSYNYFICPEAATNAFWTNGTDYDITVNLPGPATGYSWTPVPVVVIPAQSSVLIGVTGGTPCTAFAQFGFATWSSAEPAFGSVQVTY